MKRLDALFKGATHRYICSCGKIFSSENPKKARMMYKEHKKKCKGENQHGSR